MAGLHSLRGPRLNGSVVPVIMGRRRQQTQFTALSVGTTTITATLDGQVVTAGVTVVSGNEIVHGISVVPPAMSFNSPTPGNAIFCLAAALR